MGYTRWKFEYYNSKDYPPATIQHIQNKMMETYIYVINNFFGNYPDLAKRYLIAAQKGCYGWYRIVEIISGELFDRIYSYANYSPELFWNKWSLELFLNKCTNHTAPNVTVVGNDIYAYYAGENIATNGTMNHTDILALGVIIAKANMLNKKGYVYTIIRPWSALLEALYECTFNHKLVLNYDIPTGDKTMDEEIKNNPSIILVDGAPRELARLDYIDGAYMLYVSMAEDRFNIGSCHVPIDHLIHNNRVCIKDLWNILETRFRFSGYYPMKFPMDEYIEIK